ncbi:MAG: hypothetical protein IT355_11890 [Gemmatimonadaceae bacterium]|nr:hypothetical protein [Gemmatimonadaceae bacterium]
MSHRAFALLCLACVAGASGCLRQYVPAPFGTPLDEACNPVNGTMTGPVDRFVLAPAVLAVPKGWTSRERTPNELQLTRIDAELNVWRGARFVFPAVPAQNSVRCTITRGDTAIRIQASRVAGLQYRVDVEWEPPIDGQRFYMQLQTRYVDHLRQMRAIVEAVRFPADSVRGNDLRDGGGS